ncbi:MAG TPA: hypothetical protein VNP94_02455, partial [Actinomycetota bacterium]|nr:hypothetical protein [Actinomycetota bacterium]
RLGIVARLLDAQAIRPLAERAVANRQQFTTLEQYVRIAGNLVRELGGLTQFLVRPSDLAGHFDYVPHSGVLPPDPARFAQTWAQLLEGAAKIPQLLQPGPDGKVLDVRAVFNEAARALGIKDLATFYTAAPPTVLPDEALARAVQAGNAVPLEAVEVGPNGTVRGAGLGGPVVPGAELG